MSRGHNQLGPIAASYDELQSIDLLKRAKAASTFPPHSRTSALRAVLQSVELVLLNLTDLGHRTVDDLKANQIAGAAVKSAWSAGLHRLCTQLSSIATGVAAERVRQDAERVRFEDSPALAAYVESTEHLDAAAIDLLDTRGDEVRALIADASKEAPAVRFLHDLGVCYHEGIGWERTLKSIRMGDAPRDFPAFVASDILHAAVRDLKLEGDTYFMQFRCLHQVPELLSFEANDHLEEVVRALRAGDPARALCHLTSANELVGGIVCSLVTLIECLVVADYHAIRENLGITSGSHSVSLRYHLGRDLYAQVGQELLAAASSTGVLADTTESTRPSIWTATIREALRLRTLLAQWRQWHLHLPRSNLGADMTRSLAGATDAVHTATLMRDEATRDDPLATLAESYGFPGGRQGQPGPFEALVRDPSSLDRRLLELKGSITKARFPDVQNRQGYFAQRTQFLPPPRRVVT